MNELVQETDSKSISIVMPVFNTGRLLLESVRSVINQTYWQDEPNVRWELLIIDDASTDIDTITALVEAESFSSCIRVMKNTRAKGAAGARNTGIFAACGNWTRFLDSDDLFHEEFFAQQIAALSETRGARWWAAHFNVGNELAVTKNVPLSNRSPCLYRLIAEDYKVGRISCLQRPVATLLRCGCVGIMTVQIETALLRSVGGFSESLTCAEDFDLWLRLATKEDLYIAPVDAGVYRTRPGSLTQSGRPMYYGEDSMLLAAKSDREFEPYRNEIDSRLRMVYSKYSFHFRERGEFLMAARYAVKLIQMSPFSIAGWRQLIAAALRR